MTILRNVLNRLVSDAAKAYDTHTALLLGIFFSASLWWIPILGPAAAGYICGRRCGSFLKGTIFAMFSGIIVVAAAWGVSYALFSSIGFPGLSMVTVVAGTGGVKGAVGGYLESFFVSGTSGLDLFGIGVMTIFGMVGGILTWQARREVSDVLAKGAIECAIRPMSRSVDLYMRGKEPGFKSFEDCISSQGMLTNDNPDSRRSDNPTPRGGRGSSTTVQTVTTTVSSGSSTSGEGEGSPFSDILDKSMRR